MNSDELVSIIIPTFNRVDLLGETLNSVIAQTYQTWECLIVDDGSSDQTEKVVLEFIKRDSRFKFVRRPVYIVKGASACRNLGFEKSKGELIQYLDSDDLLPPNKLEMQVAQFETEGEDRVVCSGWNLFKNKHTKDFQKWPLPFKDGNYPSCDFITILGSSNAFFPPHCYLISRKTKKLAGKWDESLTNNDDAEFMSRVLLNSAGVKYIEEPRVFYRKSGADHLSTYSNRRKVLSAIRSWEKIDSLLTGSCPLKTKIYSDNGRKRLYHAVKNKFPYLIFQNKIFFKSELVGEQFRLQKTFILKKIIKNSLKKLKLQVAACKNSL